MFERYTESARRALFFSRYAVTELGGRSIETEHLLLGLIRSRTPLVERIFAEAHVSTTDLRVEVERRLAAEREKVPTSIEIPFSGDVKKALQFTAEEADRLNHRYIGPEHLLLALLRDHRTGAGSVLAARGLHLDETRQQLVTLMGESSPDTEPESPADTLAHIVHIQTLFVQFAQDALNRGAPADTAHEINEELENLKHRFEG